MFQAACKPRLIYFQNYGMQQNVCACMHFFVPGPARVCLHRDLYATVSPLPRCGERVGGKKVGEGDCSEYALKQKFHFDLLDPFD